ncbi:peptidoglycan editing factor PgeF [Cognatishimia sp. 1_MG-2023]|uniref:peptidoglycan editing factor PgeF n=1 Tax=Cognatishimia sp. 1_MG-2023 TaxID=3062642 RepID=UPI0026E3E224|nr:peptidoglycan editing factor PgeF [Cognatishimia sp. 1_MG-2023]MDO6725964.1 peptidoglycan editing factor PgeF [Cognatishimia sp. 1_MG-2023]
MTLEILSSASLSPVRHGFFTRKGGASSGVFNGLNCGTGSSDQSEIVEINRTRVAQAMDVEELARVHQVHSADVVTVTDASADHGKADAMVTNVPGIALSILTADCQPVLFADRMNGVIGAAHAGWRGALDGVLDATVDGMVALGADRDEIFAVIGPCISQRAYEVGPEFLDAFMTEDTENSRFFGQGQNGRYMFDLPAFGLHRLRETGIGGAEWIRHCTYSDPERFFSYRRATHAQEADYGRLISVIRM